MAERWDTDDDAEDAFGPDSPDYDLSEARGYGWEPERPPSRWPPTQWVIVAISLLLVAALLVPTLLLLLRS